jgi:hypothetical protein
VDGLTNIVSVGGNLWLSSNDVLCQDEVDDFIEDCTIGGVATTNGNNGICP